MEGDAKQAQHVAPHEKGPARQKRLFLPAERDSGKDDGWMATDVDEYELQEMNREAWLYSKLVGHGW